MKSTTPIQDRLDNGFKIIAIASLDLRRKPLERDDIVENHDLQYPEYATKFLNEKFRDIIEGKYAGEWLDGIKDVNYVEETFGE